MSRWAPGPRSARLRRGCCDASGRDGRQPASGSLFWVFDPRGWASTIGLILIYLTAGYYLGGRFADRRPYGRTLANLALVASVIVAVIPFMASPMMTVSVHSFEGLSAGEVS